MAGARLELLGHFRALNGSGGEIAMPSRKAAMLLARLALSPGTEIARATLTGLLWADRAEAQARGSLRQTLTQLRAALKDVELTPAKRTARRMPPPRYLISCSGDRT